MKCKSLTGEASDFEACQMLTDNAENLTSAISEALYRTKSAGIRVPKNNRKFANEKPTKPGKCVICTLVQTHTHLDIVVYVFRAS